MFSLSFCVFVTIPFPYPIASLIIRPLSFYRAFSLPLFIFLPGPLFSPSKSIDHLQYSFPVPCLAKTHLKILPLFSPFLHPWVLNATTLSYY